MTAINIELPPKLIPVFEGKADFRGAYGGRGSAKTRSFAMMTAVRGAMLASNGESGQILCAREQLNSLNDSSFAEVKAAILGNEWLSQCYEVGEKFIRTNPKMPGRVDYSFSGLRHNLESIKSKARIMLCWIDEAEPVSELAWSKLLPTIREEGSEIWVTWNPERKGSATDQRFRLEPPNSSKIVQMNWKDNPWFNKTRLSNQRIEDQEKRPDSYEWIWEGDYASVHEGAYFSKLLAQAERDKRIVDSLPIDPALPVYGFHDIGGSGAKADSYTIWLAQFVGDWIHILDHYIAQGQVLSYHINEMRRRWPHAIMQLPHDGVNENSWTGKRVEDHWRDGGFEVLKPLTNQGKGAAMQRVEAVRRILPKCKFVREKTQAGRVSLGWYHEKRPADGRDIGLGPNHDWSSHDADSFGLMAIMSDRFVRRKAKPLIMPNYGSAI